MSSDTQRIPAMSGSGHSSKYTRGRAGQSDEYSRICFTSSRMSWTSARAAGSHPSAPPMRRIAPSTSSSERWLVQSTATPAPIRSRTTSFCRSENASTRSGSRARILSTRKVVKPPTRAFSRTASGRRAVPGTPTTRSPAPTREAISAVSAVRQTIRWGKSTPVLPYTSYPSYVSRFARPRWNARYCSRVIGGFAFWRTSRAPAAPSASMSTTIAARLFAVTRYARCLSTIS